MKKKSFSVFEFVYPCEDTVQRALIVYPRKREQSPAVLYLHARRSNVWESLERARALQKKGYAVYIAPIWGLGRSQGEPDANGPKTKSALRLVIDALFKDARVDPNHVALWGVGRGAHLAADLIAGDRRFRAAVLESGVYDLEQMYQHADTPEEVKKNIQKECGVNPKVLKDRSPIRLVRSIYCPVLVVSKAQDSEAYKMQAHMYQSALQEAAVPYEACSLEGAESTDARTRDDTVIAFLDSRFHQAREIAKSELPPEQH